MFVIYSLDKDVSPGFRGLKHMHDQILFSTIPRYC